MQHRKRDIIGGVIKIVSLIVLIMIYVALTDDTGEGKKINIIVGNEVEKVEEAELGLKDSLRGKRISTIGDSISYNDKKNNGEGGKIVGYQSILEREYEIPDIINRSITGAAMAEGTRNGLGLSEAYGEDDFTDTDIMIIFSGTNDFRLDVELGTQLDLILRDKNVETFYGAYSNLIEKIMESNPDIEIHLFTPLQRDNSEYNISSTNEEGYKLDDYRVAIKEIAKYYKLHYLDMYEESGIDMENLHEFTTDGLHPNNKGYELMYKAIESHLEDSVGR